MRACVYSDVAQVCVRGMCVTSVGAETGSEQHSKESEFLATLQQAHALGSVTIILSQIGFLSFHRLTFDCFLGSVLLVAWPLFRYCDMPFVTCDSHFSLVFAELVLSVTCDSHVMPLAALSTYFNVHAQSSSGMPLVTKIFAFMYCLSWVRSCVGFSTIS